MSTEVLVIIGAGGIGQAIARRQGSGKTILLADYNDSALTSAATALGAAGHTVTRRRRVPRDDRRLGYRPGRHR